VSRITDSQYDNANWRLVEDSMRIAHPKVNAQKVRMLSNNKKSTTIGSIIFDKRE
jgi:hypothetical protein